MSISDRCRERCFGLAFAQDEHRDEMGSVVKAANALQEGFDEVHLWLRVMLEVIEHQNYPLSEAETLAVKMARDTLSLRLPLRSKEDPNAAQEGKA